MADDYDEDEEYYGEEEGYADDEGMDDYDEDDEDEGPAPSKGGGGSSVVKTAMLGIGAVVALGAVGYLAASMLFPEMVDDVMNSLPFVAKDEPQMTDTPPADGAVPPPPADGVAPPIDGTPPKDAVPPADQAAVPPPPKKPDPKPKLEPKPKPAPPEMATEGVPPGMVVEQPKPKPKTKWRPVWKKPGTTLAASTKGMTPWQAKQAARKAWLAKKAKMAKATPTKRWSAATAKKWTPASKWSANRAAKARYTKGRYASVANARAAQKWRNRSRYAKAWRSRYAAQPYTIGTRWIPATGGSAYIPWGGGGGSWQRPAGSWQRVGNPTAWHPAAISRPRGGRYGVQVGSFADSSNAAQLVGQLRAQGLPAYMGRGLGVSRVYVGSYGSRASAGAAVQNLRSQGIPAAVTSH